MGVGLISRIKIMAGMNIVERRRPQDGQLRTEIDGKEVDVRVATVATIWGEKCVMRLLDRTRSVLRLSELGMPTDSAETYSDFVRAPFGMVLCAGPTGSGKTTTLYATLTEISRSVRNVMTIEDPVEYVFPPSTRSRRTSRPASPLPPDFAPSCDRTPTSSSSERSATSRPRVSPSSLRDRSPRALVAARHGLRVRAAPVPRHGHRVLPRGLLGHRDRRATPGATDLPVVQGSYTLDDAERAFYEESGGPEKTGLRARAGATSAAARATRSASASTSCCGSPRRSSDWSSAGPRRTNCAAGRTTGHALACDRGDRPGRTGRDDRVRGHQKHLRS